MADGMNGILSISYTSLISTNYASIAGGAFAFSRGSSSIQCNGLNKLLHNTAGGRGGAIYLEGSNITISNATLSINQALDGVASGGTSCFNIMRLIFLPKAVFTRKAVMLSSIV